VAARGGADDDGGGILKKKGEAFHMTFVRWYRFIINTTPFFFGLLGGLGTILAAHCNETTLFSCSCQKLVLMMMMMMIMMMIMIMMSTKTMTAVICAACQSVSFTIWEGGVIQSIRGRCHGG